MVNANISNHTPVHNGTFNINIVFDQNVTNFTIADITYASRSGNGTSGLTFSSITGSGKTYTVVVTVPQNVEGAFSVAITGQVSVSGVSQAVTATKRTFTYDTIAHVTATLKDPVYRDNGEIVLRVTLSHDVLWFNKTDLHIKRMTGDDPSLMAYYIIGSGREYRAIFVPAPCTRGSVLVDISGTVQRATGVTRELVTATPMLIAYNNLMPTAKQISTPFKGADGYWNVLIVFTSPIAGFGVDAISLNVAAKKPVLYRGVSLDVPPAPVPDYVDGYEGLAGTQTEHCVGDWVYLADSNSVEQGRYFWLRFLSDQPPTRVVV